MDFFNTTKYKIITITLNIILIILLILSFIKKEKKQEEIIETEIIKEEEIVEKNITEEPIIYQVDIKGAVKKPGVYELSSTSNINDAIASAGGITSGGTTKNINLSKKITDQMVIYIYTTKELQNNETSINTDTCKTNEITIDTCTNNKESLIETGDNTSTNQAESNNKININTATKEQLQTLTGIGEAKANAIIEYRKVNKFVKIEDIKEVNGISDAMFEKIKEYITT